MGELGPYEIWIPAPLPNICAGCLFLAKLGPLPVDVGPRPPLHRNCRCRRERLDLSVIGAWEKIRMALWASRNRRADAEIRRIAFELVGRDQALGAGRAAAFIRG